MKLEQIVHDHKQTIGASQAHRLVTYPRIETLPGGAMNFIDDMCRISNEEFKERYESESSMWGNEQEKFAIERVQQELDCYVDDTGDNQRRLYAGPEYYDFVSALPDGIIVLDGQVITVECKCLDTLNHDFIVVNVGDSSEELKKQAYSKWVQVQVQNLCAEYSFPNQEILSIICFYDPRSEIKDFHYVIVDPCAEFRELLKRRVAMAKSLYDDIKNETPSAPVVFNAELPKTKLVKKSDDFEITPELLQRGLDELVTKAAEHFGVTIQDGHFVGGDVYNCETQEGRDLAKKAKNKVTKIRTAVLKLNQPITKELFCKYKTSLAIDHGITEKLNGLRDHVTATLTEWEKEQERIQQEQIDAENEKKRLIEEAQEKVRQAILEKMELLKVYPCNLGDLLLIAEKRAVIEAINVDFMWGDYEEQAAQLKAASLDLLKASEAGIIERKKELEKLERLNAFNEFKAKCEALSDPLHSIAYLESRLAKLIEFTHEGDELSPDYWIIRDRYIEKLEYDLIPAAKQRAIDYAAEQNKQQEAEINKFIVDHAEEVIKEAITSVDNFTYKAIEYSTNIKIIDESAKFVVDETDNILAIYEAMNPELHQRVVATAKAIPGYLESETKASYLHGLFGTTKQEAELKKAFIKIIKGLEHE